jgi:hypothetical protein
MHAFILQKSQKYALMMQKRAIKVHVNLHNAHTKLLMISARIRVHILLSDCNLPCTMSQGVFPCIFRSIFVAPVCQDKCMCGEKPFSIQKYERTMFEQPQDSAVSPLETPGPPLQNFLTSAPVLCPGFLFKT